MRKIKFRGKRIDNNKIIFGCLVNNMWTYSELSQFEKGTKVCEIFTGEYSSDNWSDAIEQDDFIFSVYPDSVSQFTGLLDKNGVEIYENDIVRILYTDWGSKPGDDPRTLEQYLTDISNIGEVVFNDNSWEVKIYIKKFDDYSYGSMNFGTHGRIEVIGNIHENPELLTQHKN